MSELSVAVVICTYEPSETVRELIESLLNGGIRPILVDDGSSRPAAVGNEVDLVALSHNEGLAAALNAGLARARAGGATHVVTFDQDSLVSADYIDRLAAVWRDACDQGVRLGALGAGAVADLTYRGTVEAGLLVVPEVVQSGTLFHLDALAAVGDFDEQLVIDGVDSDACLRLRSGGWVVAVAPTMRVEHHIGDAKTLHILGRKVLLTRHPPFRDYYMTRNRLTLIRRNMVHEPRWSLTMLRRTVVAVLLTLTLDDHRRTKAAAIRAGLADGLRERLGRLSPERRRRWAV